MFTAIYIGFFSLHRIDLKLTTLLIQWDLALNNSFLIVRDFVRFLYVSPSGIQYYVGGPYNNGFYKTQGRIWVNGQTAFDGEDAKKLHYAIADRYPDLSVFSVMKLLKDNDRWVKEPVYWTEFKDEAVHDYLFHLVKTRKKLYSEYQAGKPLFDPNCDILEDSRVSNMIEFFLQTNKVSFFYERLLSGKINDHTTLHTITSDIGLGI